MLASTSFLAAILWIGVPELVCCSVVILGIAVYLVFVLVINTAKGYKEAEKKEEKKDRNKWQNSYEEWWKSLKTEHQQLFSSLPPEHRDWLMRQSPELREWFLGLTPEQRIEYILRQKL